MTSRGEQRTLKWPKTRSGQRRPVRVKNDDSSCASSVLSLRYSSSPFESHNSSSDRSSHENSDDDGRVEPYLYEPEDSGSEETSESSDDDSQSERLNNTEW